MTKDDEIRTVAAQLDRLLDKLRDNVDALNAILTQAAPAACGEGDERLALP
jgi:ABC-type transporter Mla subunit MlaD